MEQISQNIFRSIKQINYEILSLLLILVITSIMVANALVFFPHCPRITYYLYDILVSKLFLSM